MEITIDVINDETPIHYCLRVRNPRLVNISTTDGGNSYALYLNEEEAEKIQTQLSNARMDRNLCMMRETRPSGI